MKTLLIFFLISITAFAAKPKYGPEGKPIATPLSKEHDYFQTADSKNSDYWVMAPYYVSQFNGAACSVASITAVVNAAKAHVKLTAEDKLATQEDLLDKVHVENWKERITSKTGYKGEHGVAPISTLSNITKAALEAYGFKVLKIKTVFVEKADSETKKQIRADLVENEKSQKNFMIANFLQSKFTDDSDAGHISPVGAFDAKHDKVLIMDTDREWYEPYWVSLDDFIKGMNTLDKSHGKNRGYTFVEVN